MDLKDKLAADLAKGKVNISAKDVAEFAPPAKDKREAVVGEVKTAVPEEAKQDDMINAGAKVDAGKALDKNVMENPMEPLKDVYTSLPDEVVITPDDRERFLQSLISGERFVLPFSTFNGKLQGKFRSRSQIESNAVITRINWECRSERINTGIEYSSRIRNMLLAAQLAELNGVAYELLKAPYQSVKDGEKLTDPGWLAQAEQWETQNEGLITALYKQLQIFERKYWVMVNSADDQNFWNPAESTSV